MNFRQEDIDEFISKFESSNHSTSTSGKKNWGDHAKDLLAQKKKDKKRSKNINIDSSGIDNKKKKLDPTNLNSFLNNFDSSVQYISDRLPQSISSSSKSAQDLVVIENFLPNQVALDVFNILDTLSEDDWDHSSSEKDAEMHKYQSSNAGSTAHSFSASGGLVVDASTSADQYRCNSATDMDKLMCILSSGFHSKRTDSSSYAKFTFQCGRYTEGNYIEPHDDTGAEEIDGKIYMRDLAIVLYLSPSWGYEMGGLFVDLSVHPPLVVVPKFNTLVCFKVPRLHQVTPIETVTKKRYSLFGWALTERIMTTGKNKKNKRKKNKKKIKNKNRQIREEKNIV